MKRLLIFSCLIWAAAASGQGYEIKVTLKPFKNQYIYLGHYFGKSYPIIDSAMLNDNSEAVFTGIKNLNGGIYLVGYPNKTGFFEILVDKRQKFSVIADTVNLKAVRFENSPDNLLFTTYQEQMSSRGKILSDLQQQLKTAKNKSDSTKIIDEMTKAD